MSPSSQSDARRTASSRATRLALALGSLLLSLLLAEVLVRATHLDLGILTPFLYQVEDERAYRDNQELYRPSTRAGLVYELVPGAQADCPDCRHPSQRDEGPTRLSINQQGFRGPERDPQKAPGTRRIILLGGSNTFAATVDQADTPSSQLQARLDATHPGRYEVWNAGLNAYVFSQKVLLADEIVARFSPDILIFQHHNEGRRAFFHDDPDLEAHFAREPDLYLENLPLLFQAGPRLTKLHRRWVAASALYRTVVAAHIRLFNWWHLASCPQDSRLHWDCLGPKTIHRIEQVGNEFSWSLWLRFIETHRELPLLVVDPIFGTWCPERPEEPGQTIGPAPESFLGQARPQRPNLEYLSPCNQAMPDEYRDIHPPSHVYHWYAGQLAERILEMEGAEGNPSQP